MRYLAGIAGVALTLIVLWDAFETIILPRRITRRFRLARVFYRDSWKFWFWSAAMLPKGRRRESYLGYFGPLSLLFLLVIWAGFLIVGFSLLLWAGGSAVQTPEGNPGYAADLYFSGTCFFTLGMGDVVPHDTAARVLAVIEAGMGFGFLAIVIGYLPVIYQSFSRREASISLLDARAGSPPTAVELLRRHSREYGMPALRDLLRDWERWAAELLESHLSYPVLAYFRSQHSNQSWLGALTAVLDACAFLIMDGEAICKHQAELTFAMARHAIVDLSQVFNTPPRFSGSDRLSSPDFYRIGGLLAVGGFLFSAGDPNEIRLREKQLTDLRRMYEPYVKGLADYLSLSVPPWMVESTRPDNWQTSAWEKNASPAMTPGPCSMRVADKAPSRVEDHF